MSECRRWCDRPRKACGSCAGVVLAVLAWACAAAAGPALGQAPDNRAPRLDPEDSVPPAYLDTLNERDRQRLDAAREAGESFVPLIPGPGIVPEPPAAASADPAPARPAPTPPRAAYEGYRTPERTEPAAPGGEERTAEDFRPEGLVGVLIESWTRAPEIVRLRYGGTSRYSGTLQAPAAARSPVGASAGRAGRESGRDARTAAAGQPHVAAGRGLYARTLYAVDSDYPGPVLLELLEPPLAGAVAAGQFSLVGERLTLRLSRLEYRGRSVPVDAWAVGLDCACYGVEGEVDNHWFSRVLLPGAVRFAEGFLSVLSRPAESVSIGGGDVRYERREAPARDAVHAGLAEAARTAGGVLLQSAPGGPTVRIPRNTELVVVFAAAPGAAGERGDE